LSRLVDQHFGVPEPGGTLVPKHQVDEILLLARWFRAHPEELRHTRPPDRGGALARSA
jgi:hypothetical protein